MLTFLYLFLLILFLFALGKIADHLLEDLTRLSQIIHWNKFILGFLILGIATSTPELFIAFNSGLQKIQELSLGNLLGGIVVLFTLIVGLQAVVRKEIPLEPFFKKYHFLALLEKYLPRRIPFQKHFFIHDLFFFSLIILLPIFLLGDQELSRVDGLFLISAYLLYALHNFLTRHTVSLEMPNGEKSGEPTKKRVGKIVLNIFLCLVGLFLTSWLVVFFSKKIIAQWQIIPLDFGLILLALGTNLPEITIALKARKFSDLVLGNTLGSAMANLLILGLLSLFWPFPITNWQPTLIISLSLFISTLCFTIFLKTKNKLERYEGVILLTIYFSYLMVLIFFKINP